MDPGDRRRTVRGRLAWAAAALVAALFLVNAATAVRSVVRQRAADRVCSATAERRWDEALARSRDAVGPHPEGRIAAECRCWALLARGRDAECVSLLDGLLPGDPDWVPEPALARRVVVARLEAGRLEAAASLARRAARAHPADPELLYLEVRARSLVEGEEAVLADLAARLDAAADPPLSVRLVLAGLHKQRGEPEAMLRVLGDEPPPLPLRRLPPWFEARAQAWAALGRRDRVAETYALWRRMGGAPAKVEALHALQLSFGGLVDPRRPVRQRLEAALARRAEIGDPAIVEALYERLIAHLLAAGERERALEVYEEASRRFELATITREQITHPPAPREAAGGATPVPLVFALPPDAPAGALWLSPDPEAPSDAPWERLALRPGAAVRAARRPAAHPARWVFRDEEGRTRASGAVWTSRTGIARVAVRPGPPRPRASAPLPAPGPADGRRRVFVVIPDCMDWRLLQYLRARGELPLLDHLLATGHRAVLHSDPPLTAAAMESLVWPERTRHVTLVGTVHRLGLELGGLASVGRNPLDFLGALLPESPSLFERVGARDRVAANMLFSHGGIRAGRHAVLTGPNGRERRAEPVRGVRPLAGAEAERFPRLARPPERYRDLVETTAAEMDAAVALARAGTVDLLMLRIEPLDIATHGLFSELARTRQDDGESLLLDFYRYIDARLAGLRGALDADDVLVVMSDHGIRTAMEHSTDAVFVAAGDGVPHGRAPGTPALRGVSRVLAELLGVSTPWPDTGVAGWAGQTRRHSSAPRGGWGTSTTARAPQTRAGANPKGTPARRRASAIATPIPRPSSAAARIASSTPIGPRKAPTPAMSFTSPKPSPGNHVQ